MHSHPSLAAAIAAAFAVSLPLLAGAQETPPEAPAAGTATPSTAPVLTLTEPAPATDGTSVPPPPVVGDTATTTTTVPPGSTATTTTTTTTAPTEPAAPPTPPAPTATSDATATGTNVGTTVGTNVGTNVNTNTSTSSSSASNTNTVTGTTPPPVIIPPTEGTGTVPVPPTAASNANNNRAVANVIVRNQNVINNAFSLNLLNPADRALREQSKQDYQQTVQRAQSAPSLPPPALVYWTPGAPYWAVPHCTDIRHRTVASIMRHALDRGVGLIVASGRDACFYQPFQQRGICEWYIDLGCQRERLEREMQTINPLSQSPQ